MIYEILIAPFVRRMEMDKASRIAKRYFRFFGKIPGGRYISRLVHGNRPAGLQREVFGLNFYNPLGLGAGLDRNSEIYNDLNNLGFSFTEIGPLDGKNTGKAMQNLQKDPPNDILAACINKDFETSFTLAYDFCDFFVIEPGLIPPEEALDPLLNIRLTYDVYKPIVIKIDEHISDSELLRTLKYSMMNGIDGIQTRSLAQTRLVYSHTKGRFPIMANCHIRTGRQAEELLEAGASLIEVRSGLVYDGPKIVRKMLKHLENKSKNA